MTVEHRVVGPPGCGKTTYLARQANLAAAKVGGGAVLIASLTRAAAKEVAGRDSAVPQENIGTLHAHAYRALEWPDLAEDGAGTKAWNEWVGERGLQALRITAQQADLEHQPLEASSGGATAGEEARALADMYRARMWPVEAWPNEVAQKFYALWCEWKAEVNRLDFTDLIEQCIEREVYPRCEPRIMMLDEAQDMSRLEMTLARMWGAACEQLVIVGDPHQNLYEWRGSEPEAFFAAEAASEHVLDQSYRVPKAVHAFAVGWVSQLSNYREFAYKPTPEEGSVNKADAGDLATGKAWRAPFSMLSPITTDLAAGQTVMLLASCGYMLKPVLDTLREAGVPFHNPYRVTQGAWNPLRGTNRLTAFLRPDKATWGEAARMWCWEDVRAWLEPLQSSKVLSRGIKTLVEAKCLEDRFGDSRAKDLLTMEDVLSLFQNEEDASHAFDLDVDWWESKLLASKRERLVYGLSVYRERGGMALTEEPRVIVGTIHSVKGGEADNVYVWPDLSQQGYVTGWEKPGPKRDPTIRLFYVAFTRAIRNLILLPRSGQQAVVFDAVAA